MMSKHNLMPYNWKWSQDFSWNVFMGEQLLKMKTGWTVKDHSEEDKKEDNG